MSRRNSAILTILLLIILMMFVWMLTGCRTVEKVVERERLVKDSTEVKTVDSLLIVQHDMVQEYETRMQELRDAGIVFNEIPCPDVPNTVEITPDGGIKASGSIRSANIKESTLIVELARARHTYDSLLQVKKSDSVIVKTEYSRITKTKTKKVYPWWPLAIVFILGMMAEYKFKIIRFIKQKLIP
jgi:hypothetical protein